MPNLTHSHIWQLQEAKNRLSEVIHAAERQGPQTITRHGEPVALVMPIAHGSTTASLSAWDLLRDDTVASLGGPPAVPLRIADSTEAVPLPW
ncbi:MAG: type II toxin-antitoxin system Phd/YefM family antitoxin [Planctomycetota bacterium]